MALSEDPIQLDDRSADEESRNSSPKPAVGGSVQGGPDLEERIVEALKSVYDPEIPVDIYELGLIYDVDADPETGQVHIKMTLTTPACPVAGTLPGEVQQRVEGVAGVEKAEVEIVWDPMWTPDMMSEAAKLQLGFF